MTALLCWCGTPQKHLQALSFGHGPLSGLSAPCSKAWPCQLSLALAVPSQSQSLRRGKAAQCSVPSAWPCVTTVAALSVSNTLKFRQQGKG